jgi:hypothetical protein
MIELITDIQIIKSLSPIILCRIFTVNPDAIIPSENPKKVKRIAIWSGWSNIWRNITTIKDSSTKN